MKETNPEENLPLVQNYTVTGSQNNLSWKCTGGERKVLAEMQPPRD